MERQIRICIKTIPIHNYAIKKQKVKFFKNLPFSITKFTIKVRKIKRNSMSRWNCDGCWWKNNKKINKQTKKKNETDLCAYSAICIQLKVLNDLQILITCREASWVRKGWAPQCSGPVRRSRRRRGSAPSQKNPYTKISLLFKWHTRYRYSTNCVYTLSRRTLTDL